MKIIHINSIIILLFLSFFTNCTIKYYDTNKLINDYTTEGFLDTDHYQVIIRGKPDEGAKGLVAQRESALNNAKSAMNEMIINSLIKYSLNYNISKLKIKDINEIENFQETKEILSKKLNKFLQFGYTAFEYYNEDNSAVIVYRIFKEDLVKKIESVKVDIKVRKPDQELPRNEKEMQ
jgi:hypothetical protein